MQTTDKNQHEKASASQNARTMEEMIARHKSYGLSVAEPEKASGAPELPQKNYGLFVEGAQLGHKGSDKVFIPDNSGGGTWETWKDDRPKRVAGSPAVWANRLASTLRERDKYKARAEALAEALREIVEHPYWKGISIKATEALKQYDESEVAK